MSENNYVLNVKLFFIFLYSESAILRMLLFLRNKFNDLKVFLYAPCTTMLSGSWDRNYSIQTLSFSSWSSSNGYCFFFHFTSLQLKVDTPIVSRKYKMVGAKYRDATAFPLEFPDIYVNIHSISYVTKRKLRQNREESDDPFVISYSIATRRQSILSMQQWPLL